MAVAPVVAVELQAVFKNNKVKNMKRIFKTIISLSFFICMIIRIMPAYAEDTGKIWFEEKQNIQYKKAYIPHNDLERAAKEDEFGKSIAIKILNGIAGTVIFPAMGVPGMVAKMISLAVTFGSKRLKTLTQEWLDRSKRKGYTGVTVTFMWSDPQDIYVHRQCTKLSLTHPWMDCRGKGWKYFEVE